MSGLDTPDQIARAMAGLKATIERRLAETAALESAPDAPRSRVGFDWRRLGLALRERIGASGLSLRALGSAIGVTATDLSRLTSGTNVSIEKVFAACDWAGLDARDFYLPPVKSTRCTSLPVKREVRDGFVSRAASPPAAAGPATARATTRGPQSRPRPAAGKGAK